MSRSPKLSHNLRLKPRPLLRQSRKLHTSAYWRRRFKLPPSHRVNFSGTFHINDIYFRADDCIKAETCRLKHSYDVENVPLGLRFNVFGEVLAGSRIIAHPAGAVEHDAGADGVIVVVVRLGGIDGVDSLEQGECGQFVL